MLVLRLTCAMLLVLSIAATAPAMTVPHVFGDHMVLQADQPIAIWGWGHRGESITVRFAGQQRQTVVVEEGARWDILLDALPASAAARELIITGNETITFTDVVVGEVWLCSGQSNMQKPLGQQPGQVPTDNYEQEIAAADFPQIRLLKVAISRAMTPQRDVDMAVRPGALYPWKGWVACTPASIDLVKFSAVGYYFGRRLHQELKVPIGLIDATAGGSRIESWTTPAAFAAIPALAEFAQATIDPKLKVQDAEVSLLYYGMIAPLVPYGLRGMLWYQGESNVYRNEGMSYADKMTALIRGWRALWKRDVSFYYVQLPPLLYSVTRKQVKSPESLPLIREAQAAALRLPATGMVVTTDLVTDLKDIHPTAKKPVGERLARWALARDYGRGDIEPSGPSFQRMELADGHAVIHFDHASGGLIAQDGKPLTWFAIAGQDGVFRPAEAAIMGDSVVVSCPSVARPIAVRFAWDEAAMPNLFNGEGLPASPFRTDGPSGPPTSAPDRGR